MANKTIKKLACVLACAALFWCLTGAKGARKTYEIHSQIPESVFKSESDRALDAYERLVDRALDVNKRQLDAMDLNIREVSKQLHRVEAKLDQLLNRAMIAEYALGIPPMGVAEAPGVVQPEDPNRPHDTQETRE